MKMCWIFSMVFIHMPLFTSLKALKSPRLGCFLTQNRQFNNLINWQLNTVQGRQRCQECVVMSKERERGNIWFGLSYLSGNKCSWYFAWLLRQLHGRKPSLFFPLFLHSSLNYHENVNQQAQGSIVCGKCHKFIVVSGDLWLQHGCTLGKKYHSLL